MTVYEFGGTPDSYVEDRETADRLTGVTLTAILDAVTEVAVTGLATSTGLPAASITTDAYGYWEFQCESPSVLIDVVDSQGTARWGPITAAGAVRDTVAAMAAHSVAANPHPQYEAPTAVAPAATGTAATDTANIQALINSIENAPVSAGVIGRTVVFPPGEYVLNDTITMDQWAGSFIGQGAGNSPAYSSDPGHATVFRWAGANDRPMFLITDSRSLSFENLRLEGNNTNPPTYGLEFRNAGGAAGTNEHIKISRCLIGKGTWSSQGTNTGAIGIGVGFTGTNANNDQFHIADTVFSGVATGVALPNSQSIWGLFTNVFFSTCTTAGISSAASFTATNLSFNACAIDIKVTSTARPLVTGWWSEGATRIYDLAAGAAMSVIGGKWTITSPMQGAAAMNAQNLVGADLTIRDVTVSYQITPKPPLYARGGYAPVPYRIAVEGCAGWSITELDVQGYGAAGVTFADIDCGGVSFHGMMQDRTLTYYTTPRVLTAVSNDLYDEEHVVICGTPVSSSVNMSLPLASACRPGITRIRVKNINAATATIYASGSDHIDGATTKALAQWASAELVTDGTNWLTV